VTTPERLMPKPLIKLIVEPQDWSDVDLPTDVGITEEAIAKIQIALSTVGFKLIGPPENLGIGD
jgi:hypothetical protein